MPPFRDRERNELTERLAAMQLRSCLISGGQELLFEHYRDDTIQDEIAKTNSCTKSVLSALICIAMDRGQLPGAETPAAVFFPRLADDPDPRKAAITLEQLLNMSAGFEWNEFGGLNSFPRMIRTPDWVNFVLDLPLAEPPGAGMVYNSGISQLLATILAKAVGNVAAYAEETLFRPLGIDTYKWETDPDGVHTGGFGLSMKPGDMLKFGQLFLQEGMWEGQRVIAQELVRRSVSPALPADPSFPGQYGWHWWIDALHPDGGGQGPSRGQPPAGDSDQSNATGYYYARGFGGQFIYVVPALDTVVVLTSESKKRKRPDAFREYIGPLLLRRPI